ncbi:MAG: hypothetical protein DRP33_04470 [Thermotogae bacterium]|nr:MAG: hypothetical protein DRP33_04470 [Thermotogota bacterium]
MKLKFIGYSTSPRKSNTLNFVQVALEAAKRFANEFGVEADTQAISFSKKKVYPCYNCDMCIKRKTLCVLKDDWLELVEPLLEEPNGLIIASPVYFFSTNSIARAFMERFTCLEKKIWDPSFPYEPPDFSKTVAAAMAVGFDRNGGVEHTVSNIIDWLLVTGFTTVGGFYIGGMGWTMEQDGTSKVLEDERGVKSAKLCGYKVAKVALLMKGFSDLPNVTWNFEL